MCENSRLNFCVDTIYTERYMGLPTNESNWVGYEAGNVMSRVNNFRHKLFYLIHGSADDNVHFQQSMMLTRALELADITFFQQVLIADQDNMNYLLKCVITIQM